MPNSHHSSASNSLPEPSELSSHSPSAASSGVNLAAWQSRELSPIALPVGFPENVQIPKYSLGDRCRWIPNPQTDWGTIIGQIYTSIETGHPESQWSWLYLLLLDADSPSRPWIAADWVEEEVLEQLPSGLTQSNIVSEKTP